MPRRLALFISLLILYCTAAAQQNWCRITGTVVVGERGTRSHWKNEGKRVPLARYDMGSHAHTPHCMWGY